MILKSGVLSIPTLSIFAVVANALDPDKLVPFTIHPAVAANAALEAAALNTSTVANVTTPGLILDIPI